MTTVLITGVLGQDGQLLARRLLTQGHEVIGVSRGTESLENPRGWAPLASCSTLDLSDREGVFDLIRSVQPDVLFHLAGQTSVGRSWDAPLETFRSNVTGTANVLEAVASFTPSARVVITSSGEVFAPNHGETLLDEDSPTSAQSPYAVSKLLATEASVFMRDYTGVQISVAYLFPHESVDRPVSFVSRKITRNVARIALGDQAPFELGNVDAVRDWGWAEDYIDGLIRISSSHPPSDYVLATGVGHSVREFLTAAFQVVGIEDYSRYVRTDASLLRKNDTLQRLGDAGKARRELGWEPRTQFVEIVKRMVEHDMADMKGRALPDEQPGS